MLKKFEVEQNATQKLVNQILEMNADQDGVIYKYSEPDNQLIVMIQLDHKKCERGI